MTARLATIQLQLFGAPECRRYQKMRTQALEAAAHLGLVAQLEEINDTERLSQSSPLGLPRLVANGVVLASSNPPKISSLVKKFQDIALLKTT